MVCKELAYTWPLQCYFALISDNYLGNVKEQLGPLLVLVVNDDIIIATDVCFVAVIFKLVQ